MNHQTRFCIGKKRLWETRVQWGLSVVQWMKCNDTWCPDELISSWWWRPMLQAEVQETTPSKRFEAWRHMCRCHPPACPHRQMSAPVYRRFANWCQLHIYLHSMPRFFGVEIEQYVRGQAHAASCVKGIQEYRFRETKTEIVGALLVPRCTCQGQCKALWTWSLGCWRVCASPVFVMVITSTVFQFPLIWSNFCICTCP